MAVIDDLLSKKPETREVLVPLDPDLARRYHLAKLRLDSAEAGAKDDDTGGIAQARADLDALEARMQGNFVRLTFSSIGSEDMEQLRGEHPPTEKQRAQARRAKQPDPEWNVDSFPPVLVAAACTKVETPEATQQGLSLDEVKRLWESATWTETDRAELFAAALSAYSSATRIDFVPKSFGSSGTTES